jgi:SRSO17 transposase
MLSEQCPSQISKSPLTGSIEDFSSLTVEQVNGTAWASLWDELISCHHYLGYRKLLGNRLKYLVFLDGRVVAALSFSAAAVKLGVRDRYIGWSDEQRKRYLPRIVNNSRFLILPWITISNLASKVLSLTLKRLPSDWYEHFSQRLFLVETFVDPRYFDGSCYKASNWIYLGMSGGYSKIGMSYRYHGHAKKIYMYEVTPDYRAEIGCCQKDESLFQRTPRTLKQMEALKMILNHHELSPDLIPTMALGQEDIQLIAEELVEFHEEFHACFGRSEHTVLGLSYLSGLLSNLDAKSAEPIALAFLGKERVRSQQRFMKSFKWDHEEMERRNQLMLSEVIADEAGMINVDSSEFVKKGKESVGVARQYCGRLGKVENCQSGVFVGYASDKGYGLLTCRLYMPESWFSDEQADRREFNLVPEEVTFQTKPEIARDLIATVKEADLFPARWIGCDATFGSDHSFLKSLPEDLFYFANIRSDMQVFLDKPQVAIPAYRGRGRPPSKPCVVPDQPKPISVATLSRSSHLSWQFTLLAEGAQGPIIAHVARIRVYLSRDGLPDDEPVWLFFRRMKHGDIKYAISNAPEDMPMAEMKKASLLRWPIEQCFQDGKDQLGMASYEHRSWPAWHRHMIYVFLAQNFLLRLRLKFKKNANSHAQSGEETGDGCASASISR